MTLQTKNRYVIEVTDRRGGNAEKWFIGPIFGEGAAIERARTAKLAAAFDGTRTCTVHELYEDES